MTPKNDQINMNQYPEYYFSGLRVKPRTDKRGNIMTLSQTRSHYQLPQRLVEDSSNTKVSKGQVTPILARTLTRQNNQLQQTMDRRQESLFDELQSLKKLFHEQQVLIKNLKTSNSYLKAEILRYETGSTPQVELPMNAAVRFRNDQLTKLQRELLDKDRIIERLKQAPKHSRLLEMGNQNRQLQLQNEELRAKLQRSINMSEEGEQRNLKRDNVELTYLVKQQEQVILDLQGKSQEEGKRFVALRFKYKGLKQLQEKQYQELLLLKERDTLFTQHQQSKSQNDKMLREQLEQMQEEINRQNSTLSLTQNRLMSTEKRLRDSQQESADRISFLERELGKAKSYCNALKEELEVERKEQQSRNVQMMRKHSVMLNSFNVASPEESRSHHIPGARQSQVIQLDLIQEEYGYLQSFRSSSCDLGYLAKVIKYRLINMHIDLKDIDEYLFTAENLESDEVYLGDLRVAFQHQVFGLREDAQFMTLAKYLSDFDDKVPFVTVARARSIFKTLMENYQLPKMSELQSMEDTIKSVIDNQKLQFLEYVQKKHLYPQDKYPIDELIESFKAFDAPFTQQHHNHIIARLYAKHGDITHFHLEDLNDLFAVEQPITQDLNNQSHNDFNQEIDMSHNPFANDDSQQENDVFKMVDSQGSIKVDQDL